MLCKLIFIVALEERIVRILITFKLNKLIYKEVKVGINEGGGKMVSFDDFSKLDIRIGEVLSVDEHPNADKLYVLRVDIGEKVIQLVAGIKNYYAVDELTGKNIVVLTNLEPRILRGVESQGMLLAAQSEETVSVLSPDREVPAGSKVR